MKLYIYKRYPPKVHWLRARNKNRNPSLDQICLRRRKMAFSPSCGLGDYQGGGDAEGKWRRTEEEPGMSEMENVRTKQSSETSGYCTVCR